MRKSCLKRDMAEIFQARDPEHADPKRVLPQVWYGAKRVLPKVHMTDRD